MEKAPKKVGIVRFPGSNCDFDTVKFFKAHNFQAEFIWHKERKLPKIDLLILPGGFAFGDRVYETATGKFEINPGEMALKSPVMDVIFEAVKQDLPILGICNGFQILVKAGLLPGELKRNASGKFVCDNTVCKVSGNSFFGDGSMLGKLYDLPVAHGFGKYGISKKEYRRLLDKGQIFLKYQKFNPNGSYQDIAGVCNDKATIFGMMPHPERSPDGEFFAESIKKYLMIK